MEEHIIYFFRDIAAPWLDTFAKGVTMAGEDNLIIVLLTWIYWNISKKNGVILCYTYLFSVFLNNVMKLVFRSPRPFQVLNGIEGKRLETATGYSFPSGHTQSSATFFLTLYLLFRKRWMIAIMIIIPLLVGISRVYLGVHWPVDVIGGWGFGIIVSFVVYYFLHKYYDTRKTFRFILLLSINFVLIALLSLIWINNSFFDGTLFLSDTYKIGGIFTGVVLGFLLEENSVLFSVTGTTLIKIVRYFIGVIITFLLMTGLKKLFPEQNAFHFVRYFITGFWVSFIFPYLGTRLKLFSIEKE
jgi:membrane-associated phospholipid phosphatase